MPNSEQTTYRFFVDNKRVATAVFWERGSKHRSPILEVYPRQSTILPSGRPLTAIFHSEEDWHEHCLANYYPLNVTRVNTTSSYNKATNKIRYTYRFCINDKRVATAIRCEDNSQGTTILQVFPPKQKGEMAKMFRNEDEWREYCEQTYNPKPVTRFEVTKKEVKEIAATPVFVPKRNWICPACNKGPGNDHRMCICRAFNFSVEAWEIAVGLRAPEPDNAPPAPTYPAPSEVPSSVTTRLAAAAEAVNQDAWTHKETYKFTAPAGKYYIGDLCYALSNDLYDGIFGNLGGYDSGLYQKKDSTDFFLVDNTAYGDGLYGGTDGKEFAVDAGIIGICPASMIGPEKDGDGGHIYEFKEPVKCRFGGGVFTFKSGYIRLVINTEGDDDESE